MPPLKKYICLPEVRNQLRLVRPKQSRCLNLPLIAPPQTDHYLLVGGAFDYLLRYEIQRLAPDVVQSQPWEISERALDFIFHNQQGRLWTHLTPQCLMENDEASRRKWEEIRPSLATSREPGRWVLEAAERLRRRADQVVEAAKAAWAA
jgi:hypothetical protein